MSQKVVTEDRKSFNNSKINTLQIYLLCSIYQFTLFANNILKRSSFIRKLYSETKFFYLIA